MLKPPKCIHPYSRIVESPKQILAYLKLGCEIKQVGQNESPLHDKKPKYFLIAPNLQWEYELKPEHVRALETLELIYVECSVGHVDGNYWISKGDFSLPEIEQVPELVCVCGWQGDSSALKSVVSATYADSWCECPSCAGEVMKMTRMSLQPVQASSKQISV